MVKQHYDAAYQIQIFEHFMVIPQVMQHILFLLSIFLDVVLFVGHCLLEASFCEFFLTHKQQTCLI